MIVRSAHRVLTVPAAEEIIGGSLSNPSKMPCPAWGISASECRRGSDLAKKPGSVCASCYAKRGHYTGRTVVAAHERRLAALADPRWPDAMALLIRAYANGGHFRWFDSGDLQSEHHLDMILWVARRTPTVSHWLPTHEGRMASARRAPSNLTLRISADLIGEPVTDSHGLPTSTVHRMPGQPVRRHGARCGESIECLAYRRGHHCGTCRACWSPTVRNVSYLLNAGLRAIRHLDRVHLSIMK